MMIRAYSEDYLNNAQKILGDMMDYAVNTYELSPNQFYEMFLVSDGYSPPCGIRFHRLPLRRAELRRSLWVCSITVIFLRRMRIICRI